MNRKTLWIFPLLLAATAVRAENGALKNDDQKTLYALGAILGQKISILSLKDADLKYVSMGLSDTAQGKKPAVDVPAYAPKIDALAQARQQERAAPEKKAAKTFLDEAAKAKGAVTTPSGLIFLEVKKGSGASPKATDTVKVHYHGTLRDGSVFDSSIKRGTPAEFPLNGVIPCWTEGVQKMKVGGKARLVCPSTIAYGDEGRPPVIPSGAALAFEVELLSISNPK